MDMKNILINSRYKFANAIHDTKDVITSYNESAEIPELDNIAIKFNNLLTEYDNLINEVLSYI